MPEPVVSRSFPSDDEQRKWSVLAVSALEEDHVSLRDMLRQSNWNMLEAHTCREALEVVHRNQIAVLLCERDLPDGSWKDVWQEIALFARHPLLIVFSLHADNYLWAEALSLGAYDVLAKPLEGAAVRWAVDSAWRRWEVDRRQARTARKEAWAA